MSTKRYRIQLKFYRDGMVYPPDSIVEVPADFKPARTWVEVKGAESESTPKKSAGK